mgnify:CR=1 FL=1
MTSNARGQVVVIEDDDSNRRTLSRALTRDGYRVEAFHEAPPALEYLRENRDIVLVITDLKLPGMDGFAALEKLKANEHTKTIPVIALTANVMPRDIERGRQAGFYTYLTKPIRINEIASTVSEALPSKRIS